jgi:transposase-like protein
LTTAENRSRVFAAKTEEEIVGPGGLLSQLTKRLVERAMEVELTDHLGYEPHQEPPGGAGNTRNWSTSKTLATEHGPVGINTPRDRRGTFEPQIARKRQRRFEGFDDKILALYSRGLSDARYRGAPGRHLRRQGRAGLDQPGHRRGDGRRPRLAAASA